MGRFADEIARLTVRVAELEEENAALQCRLSMQPVNVRIVESSERELERRLTVVANDREELYRRNRDLQVENERLGVAYHGLLNRIEAEQREDAKRVFYEPVAIHDDGSQRGSGGRLCR